MSRTAGAELVGQEKVVHVQTMFGRIVRRYDLMNALMTMGMDRGWRRATVQAAKPISALALDLATGTGEMAVELARQGARQIVGIDLTPGMIQAAERKTNSAAPGRVLNLVGDAVRLPFPDNTFDCLVNGFLLRNVADLSAAFREMARVLKPEGRLVCLEITHRRPGLATKVFDFYFYRIVPLLGRAATGESDAYRYLPNSLTHFPDAEKLASLIAASGLAQVHYRRLGMGTVALHSGVKPR